MNHILIIEDNKDVNHMLAESLASSGYRTTSAYSGTEGLHKFRADAYDLVLLDLMLPYKSGDELLKEIRRSSGIPVIVISAKDITGTKIDLLRLGADDYITKPFDLGEVTARIEAALRRTRQQTVVHSVYTCKNLIIDTYTKTACIGTAPLELTAREYAILELLAQHKEKVFTKANLYESIWNEQYLGDDNVIKTHISNLRAKLQKADSKYTYIETVWGLGYRMKDE